MTKTKKNSPYNSTNYNSSDGMLTYVWGPAIWHFLHTISFNYPIHPSKTDKVHYMNFIKGLRNILPCKYCRINLTKTLKQNPITLANMENRETFSRFIYQLHESINHMLNKSSGLSYEEVRDRYEHFRSRCLDTPGTPISEDSHKKG